MDAFDYVPRPVLEHLSRQLGMPAPELTTLRALYRRQMPLFLHQRWACEHAGFRWHAAAAIAKVIDALVAGTSKMLQNWEQGRRQPSAPAAVLLMVLLTDPDAVLRAMR